MADLCTSTLVVTGKPTLQCDREAGHTGHHHSAQTGVGWDNPFMWDRVYQTVYRTGPGCRYPGLSGYMKALAESTGRGNR